MKTIIDYFTGTGNSLAAAKRIGALLGDSSLVPVASLKDTPGAIVPDAGRVGIVCPVYDCGVPVMVAEFVSRLGIPTGCYVFAVVTMVIFIPLICFNCLNPCGSTTTTASSIQSSVAIP